MFEAIQNVVFDVTGKRGLTYDTDFIKDLHLNSFDIMNIICAFEDNCGIRIPTRDVWQLRTVRDVMNYLTAKGVKL